MATIAWHRAKNLPHQFAKKNPIQLVLYKIQEESTGVVIPDTLDKKIAIFIAPNNKKRIASVFTKDLEFINQQIVMDNVDTLTYVEQDEFDHIFLENKQGGSMAVNQSLKKLLQPLTKQLMQANRSHKDHPFGMVTQLKEY